MEFLEAGKRRLAGDTACAASTGEVNILRREVHEMKEVVAEQVLEMPCSRKSMFGPPDHIKDRVVELALAEHELSPRELAERFTDTIEYFKSESLVY